MIRQESQQNLIDFLYTDLDLCRTMLKTARLASDRQHYNALLDTIRRAIETVRTLSARVQDTATWTALHMKAEEVEAELRSFPPWDERPTQPTSG